MEAFGVATSEPESQPSNPQEEIFLAEVESNGRNLHGKEHGHKDHHGDKKGHGKHHGRHSKCRACCAAPAVILAAVLLAHSWFLTKMQAAIKSKEVITGKKSWGGCGGWKNHG